MGVLSPDQDSYDSGDNDYDSYGIDRDYRLDIKRNNNYNP